MFVGVFLNDADDFLSNTAKYNALLGVKVKKKTSKLANLSQILTILAWKLTPLTYLCPMGTLLPTSC